MKTKIRSTLLNKRKNYRVFQLSKSLTGENYQLMFGYTKKEWEKVKWHEKTIAVFKIKKIKK